MAPAIAGRSGTRWLVGWLVGYGLRPMMSVTLVVFIVGDIPKPPNQPYIGNDPFPLGKTIL